MLSIQKKVGQGSSHAKIILIGEHAVVYSQPAIALPLHSLKTSAKVTLRNDKQKLIKSSYYSGQLEDMPKSMTGINHLITYLLDKQPLAFGFTLELESQLPIERGMGSSASVAVAIVRAFYDLFSQGLSHKELLALANIAEKETHKNPSGLDVATTSSNTPVWMIKDQVLEEIPLDLDAYLVICDSGIKGKTAEAILAVKEKLHATPEDTNKLIEQIGQLSRNARKQLAHNDVNGLGKTLDQAQTHLSNLGVSDPTLDKLIVLARKNGALGAKLTGGGRGGCFICLVDSAKKAKQLSKLMSENGAVSTWIEPLNHNKDQLES